MSLLPPLGLPAVSPSSATIPAAKPVSWLGSAPGTTSPSGRVAGSDIVNQPENVTPSRTMLEVRRAVEAELLAGSQDSATDQTVPTGDAPERYAAIRQMLPV